MTLPKDRILPSGKTLGQVRADLDLKFKGKNRSKKSSNHFPSMTLEAVSYTHLTMPTNRQV